MSGNKLTFETGRVSANISKEELKEYLLAFCDNDYSGRNGEEYFVVDDCGTPIMSKFDARWEDVKDKLVIEIIEEILHDNFSTDYYYTQFDKDVFQVGDEIVFAFAYTS